MWDRGISSIQSKISGGGGAPGALVAVGTSCFLIIFFHCIEELIS